MTQDDVLFGYRLQLFALAARARRQSQACRLMGVHRSTYYRWKRAGRAPRAGDAAPARAPPAADAQPALGDGRAADRGVRARPPRAGAAADRVAAGAPGMGRAARLSPTASTRRCVRHGLNTRAKRLALVAGYRAPYRAAARARARAAHRHAAGRASWSASTASSSAGCTAAKGAVWQITAIDTYSSYAWADLVVSPPSGPDRRADLRARPPRRRRARSPPAGSSSACSPTTATSSARAFAARAARPAPATARSAPGARRPTATSNACTARSSRNAGDPRSRATSTCASAACRRDLAHLPRTTTTTTANTTDESRPGDARPTSSTVPARWSRDEPHLSACAKVSAVRSSADLGVEVRRARKISDRARVRCGRRR